MSNRENYYILLDLSPTVTDWPSIEAAISKKRGEWSKQKISAALKLRNTAAKNLKSISVITSLMQDESLRLNEAREATKLLKALKESDLNELDGLIKGWNSKHYTQSELNVLAKQFKGSLTETDIETRLHLLGIDKQTVKKKKATKLPQLIPAMAKSIATELRSLNYKSLYQFLSEEGDGKVSSRSSCKTLCKCADKIYNETMRVGKTDPRSTTVSSLASRAKSVFINKDQKQKYDNTLATENLALLDKLLEVVGRNNYIDEVGMVTILTRAKELHINEETAERYIEDYASKRKWLLKQTSEKIKLDVRICGLCDHVNPLKAKHCQNCSTPLEFPCPKCRKEVESHHSICGHCGFNTGDAPLIISLFEKATSLIKKEKYDEAKEHLLKCEEYSPDWPGVRAEIEEIERHEKERLLQIADIRRFVSKRLMFEAQKLIDQHFSVIEEKSLKELVSKIKIATDDASRKYRAAQEMFNLGKTEEAYLEFGRCIQVCADFPQALSEQKKIPPTAPKKVWVAIENTAMRISWEKSKSAGDLVYILVRKANAKPMNITDGQFLAETKSTEFYDDKTQNGKIYYYGVFCKRGTGISKERCHSSAVIRCDDITHLEAQVSATSVLLNWKKPENCDRVEVWRSEEKIPPYQGRGSRFENLDTSFLDNKVTNGKHYGYLVVACYNGTSPGSYNYSTGIGILASAISPPKPLSSFRLEKLANQRVELSWQLSELGGDGLCILQSDENPKLEEGKVTSKNVLNSKGHMFMPGTNDSHYTIGLATLGTFYFTPLTVRDEMVAIGKSCSVSFVTDVTNVQSASNGNTINLTWDWPDNAKEVLVVWTNNRFITSPTSTRFSKQICLLAEYNKQGQFELVLDNPQKLYLTLFVKADDGSFSGGFQHLETMGMETIVKYKLQVTKRTLFRTPKEACIILSSNEPVELKNIMLYKGSGEPPLTQNEGCFVKHIKHLTLASQSNTIEITEDDVLQKNDFIKLFFADPKKSPGVRLMPDAANKLKYR